MKKKKIHEYSDDQICKGIENLCQESAPAPQESAPILTPKEKQFIKKTYQKNTKGKIKPQ